MIFVFNDRYEKQSNKLVHNKRKKERLLIVKQYVFNLKSINKSKLSIKLK